MKNESIFEHLKGAKPVAPNVLAKLEEGMKKIVEQSREKDFEKHKAAHVARGWVTK